MTQFLTDVPTYNNNQLMLGLVVGVVLLIFLIIKTKVHPFMALVISAIVIALVGGVPLGTIPTMITDGFGSTLGSIGIIIGLGIILSTIFEKSGAGKQMARVFIKMFGKGRENIALAVTGFIVSIPVFCDSGFIILFPIAKAISEKTRKNLVVLGGSLALGLILTHSLIPPTPGPVAAANEFGVNLGTMFLLGLVICIPAMFAGLAYLKWLGKNKIYLVANEGTDERGTKRELEVDFKLDLEGEDLPPAFLSFLPIIIPIFLILFNNLVSGEIIDLPKNLVDVIGFLGHPVVAVTLGTLVAIYTLTLKYTKEDVLADMDHGIKAAGITLLVTGGGGALGQVIKSTGLGEYLAVTISGIGIPLIILPFVISTIVRFIQGSGTVSIITAASISAPIILAAPAGSVNLTLAALAACTGSLFFSYFNDSFFHVINRTIGITNSKDQIKLWSITSTVAWATAAIILFILSIFL